MPVIIIAVDLFGLVLMLLGFHLAFRQDAVLRWWSIVRQARRLPGRIAPLADGAPARYAFRIAGVMLLAFGMAMSLLFTLSYFAG